MIVAKRPIFVVTTDGPQLVREVFINFEWVKGIAPSQKRKNVISLHKSAKQENIFSILEVSTKSEIQLGIDLSAFNLILETDAYGFISIESVFQGSKVFTSGGPFMDLYGKSGPEIKKDKRLNKSGQIIKFTFEGETWDLEPKTAFYDWLYLHAVNLLNIDDELKKYQGFTDIEFNPKKSINCQARSCALYVSLMNREILQKAMEDKQLFLELLKEDSLFRSYSIQGKLL